MNGVDTGEPNINRIMHADDTVITASTEEQLNALMNELVIVKENYMI